MAFPPRIRLSFRGKLHVLVFAALLLGVLSSTAWVVSQQAVSSVEDRQRALVAIAEVLGSITGRAAAEHDRAQAFEALRSIRSLPGVLHARVTTDRGKLAELGHAAQLDTDLRLGDNAARDGGSVWHALTARTIEVSVPIVFGGRTVGALTLIGDTSELAAKLLASAAMCSLSGLLAIGVAGAVAGPLSKRMLRPLGALTATVEYVKRSQDYSVQVDATSEDEVGVLVEGFNAMLLEIARSTAMAQQRELEIVTLLMKAAEHRDHETGDHVARVARYVSLIMRNLNCGPAEQRLFALASTMHDIGKLAVPDAILLKPGLLTAEERLVMQRHTLRGRAILEASKSDVLQLAAEIAESHHERWDGKGYPHGLRGEKIPIGGRAVAVADVFDALTSARPYKAPWSPSQARAYLEDNSGTLFDPACVSAFLAGWREVEAMLSERARGKEEFLLAKVS